jgi:dipeptidyl aminopeptidase/acylaminoacyl peptidase
VLLESNEEKTVLDWSADGKALFYSVLNGKTGRDIWILPMTGNERTPSLFLGSPFQEDHAEVGPDSHWVLYRSNESGQPEHYVQPLPPNGQKWQISNSPASEAQWRGDGREILYVSNRDMLAVDVAVVGPRLQPGAPKKLFQFPLRMASMNRNRFVVSRDGQRFLAIMPEEARDEALTPFVVILNWPRLLEIK